MTAVNDPRAPLHTGSGDMYINPNVILRHVEDAARNAWDARWMARDELRWLKQRFAEPGRLGAARNVLGDSRTLLLLGPAGSGRRTAAKMLLNERTDASTPFGFLLDEADDPSSRLSPSRVEIGHRLLLDLSHSDAETLQARQRELTAFRDAIEQRDACLVVVLPNDLDHHLDAGLLRHVVEIEHPHPRTALERQLGPEGIELTEDDLNTDLLAPHLAGAMRDIAELAATVVRARDEDPRGSASIWLKEAVTAVPDRQREVAEQVEATSSARQRAVLFAAAMCEGASTDGVFFAAQALLELQELTAREGPRLEQTGYHEQLRQLVITVRANHRVGFARYAYDRAVRAHFWDNYPDLRESFSRWVGEALRSAELTHPDRESLVERFLEQALRSGAVEGVRSLVDRWSNPTRFGGPSYWMQFATRALMAGLNDEQHGRRFRRYLYDWSRNTELATHAGHLLVHLCTEVIAPNFPEQALVRLHHRARRETGDELPTARSALLDLTSRNCLLLRMLLDRLSRGCDTWSVDLPLFLEAADPVQLVQTGSRSHPLAAEPAVRSHLIHGWRTAMSRRPDLAWPVVRTWLQAAKSAHRPDLLLRVLVEAAGHDIRLLGALHVVTRDWSSSDAGNADIAARTAQHIDAALGIDAADHSFQDAS